MRNRIVSLAMGIGGALAIAACASPACAQYLRDSGRSRPALGDRLGRTGYGEGILDLGQYRSGGSVLHSSMYGGSEIGRSPRGRAFGGSGGGSGLLGGTQIGPSMPMMGKSSDDSDMVGAIPEAMEAEYIRRRERQAMILAYQYLDVIGANTTEALAKNQVVTTLVPDKAGAYRELMAQGEKALLAGGADVAKAHEAVDAFIRASLLTYRNPDVLLSLSHAHFLISRYSYVSASQYLQEALAILPELPLLQLDPKAFLGGSEVYDNRMARLEEHLRAEPDDPDGLLLRAYFKWFESDGAATAAESLRQAYALARRPKIIGLAGYPNYDAPGRQLADSIEIFWKAMLKSGKVSGSLAPATAPAPMSKPSAPASAPAEGAGGMPPKT